MNFRLALILVIVGVAFAEDKMKKETADDATKPAADVPVQQQPTAPATCKASVKGTDATLTSGQRYCSSNTNYRTCYEKADGTGDFVEDTCPENAQCMELNYQVLCRLFVRNKETPAPPVDAVVAASADAAPAAAAATA